MSSAENAGPIAPAPVTGAQRLDVLDALRGIALFGVLLVNLRDFSLYSLLPPDAATLRPAWESVLEITFSALIDVKAATLFSLLFGVGFALQMQRAGADAVAARRYVRRLLLLLIIGLAHALLWWGDILRYYAVLGLLLVPLGTVRPRTLALAGVLIALCAQPLLRPWLPPLLPAPLPAGQATAAALAAFSGDSVNAMLGANLEYDMHRRVAGWSLAFFVLGRLLLGAALGYAGVLQQPQRHLAFWRRLLAVALPLGIACTAFVLARDHGLLFAEGWWKGQGARVVSSVLRNASSLALALAYMALVVLLFQRPRWRGWLARFAPVGRMALSNYLAQTVFGIALFYGIGLGLGPRYGLAGTLLAALVVFAAQTAASRWWLRRFSFGPAEWLWRSLTYGRAQPLRRRPDPALPARAG